MDYVSEHDNGNYIEMQLPIDQCGDEGVNPSHSLKSEYNWIPPNLTLVPYYLQHICWRTSNICMDTKCMDTQGPYVKWQRTMPAVSPLHLQIPNVGQKCCFCFVVGWICGCKAQGVRGEMAFTEKNFHLCWPTQFKPVQGSMVYKYLSNQQVH